MSPITSILILVLATCALTSALPQVFLRQEASFAEPNFGCQCNSYIFRDENGQVQGNCRSTRNGAQWCFVNPGSSCQDTGPSPFGRPWSYEACATPSRGQAVSRRMKMASLQIFILQKYPHENQQNLDFYKQPNKLEKPVVI